MLNASKEVFTSNIYGRNQITFVSFLYCTCTIHRFFCYYFFVRYVCYNFIIVVCSVQKEKCSFLQALII